MIIPIRSLLPGFFSGVFLLLASASLLAQSRLDSVQSLPEVEVKATFDRQQAVGSIVRTWSLEELAQLSARNLGEILALETNAYLKSYGLGSLATSSIRGGSAGQTLILWNGLPLQSPMLGQLDLALLPAQMMEQVSLARGGGSSLWGSGAIGAVLNLHNRAEEASSFALSSQTHFGSFGQLQQQLRLSLGGQKWQAVGKLSHQQARNDFFYPLGPGLPERQQTNAALSQQSFLQDFYWKVDDKRKVAAHLWWQSSDREIPPTNVQVRSEARQEDQSMRLQLAYTQTTRRGQWQIKAGFFDELLNYYDEQIRLASESRFHTYLSDLSATWRLGEYHHLLLGTTQSFTQAWSAGYREEVPRQWRSALFSSWKGTFAAWQYQLSLRQEMVDGRFVPLTPALGLNWTLGAQLSLKAKVSHNYRLPTFNDLYWQPGGNPDLLPESGWSQELGLEKTWQIDALKVNTSITAFNRLIDNWILWSIREEQSFWSANNITQVWSRGLEPRLGLSYAFTAGQISWQSGYDYIRSTNQVALEKPRMAAGTQLLYTPVHQFFTKVSLQYKCGGLTYHHRITGATQGINEALPVFQVGRIGLQWKIPLEQYQVELQAKLNNSWDTDYQIMERRPMPGRHYQLSILFSYQQK